ncbi:MAG: hypothetical protein OEV42_15475 [Deltaproteobacteria bacterium]|nr:hypothetical protein [Deltaproteobacteria bacterium]
MEKKMENLNKLLTAAAGKLDKSAALITELDLDKKNNRERIAEALANIFQIQHQIYELKPELKPDYLKRDASPAERKSGAIS